MKNDPINKNKITKRQNGFTLLEVVMALLILSIGMMAIMQLQSTSLDTAFKGRRITQTAFLGSETVEQLMASTYTQVVQANPPVTVSNGNFRTQYVVSNNDTPIPNVKTITVSSWWVDGQMNTRGLQSYVYYKADKF